jgi:hypothetical protein
MMMYRLLILTLALSLIPCGQVFSADVVKKPSEQEFCRLYKNNDREISFEEFSACEFYKLEHVRELPFTDLKDLKEKNNGMIPDEELKAYLFKKADKNRDNKIDRQEWEEFYSSIMGPGGSLSRPHLDRR